MSPEPADEPADARAAIVFGTATATRRSRPRAPLIGVGLLLLVIGPVAIRQLPSHDGASHLPAPTTYGGDVESDETDVFGDGATRIEDTAPAVPELPPLVIERDDEPAPPPVARARPARSAAERASRLFARSIGAYESSRYDDARRAAEAAHAHAPDDPRIANHLAAVHLARGAYEDAERWATRALETDPNLTRAYTNLGVATARQGRHAEAAATFQRALSQRPDDWKALVGLANAYGALSRYDDALDAIAGALEAAPHRAEVSYTEGRLLVAAGHEDDAREAFRRYLDRSRGADPERERRVRSWITSRAVPSRP